MLFNQRTKDYLNEMQAVLVQSKYKVFQIDFESFKAYVNKQDVYKKRNGKTCSVEHHFGKWIEFKKEDISYGMSNSTRIESSFYGLEEVTRQKKNKYLNKEVQQRIVDEYLKTLKLN